MMVRKLPLRKTATLAAAVLALAGASVARAAGYYAGPTIFQPYPSETDKKPWNVKNLGPVGIGIDITQPGFVMVISNVEKGSPAELTGKLKKGQIIESINGQVLKDRDPRIILGDLVTDAEAKDGKIDLRIKDVGSVVVTIPVMGAYSPTWPLNCPKSDKIVRGLADQLAKDQKPRWGSILFLLSTGEEKDLDVVRKWVKDLPNTPGLNWDKGYNGPGLCEYYLRTGDKTVLPIIKTMVDDLKSTVYSGGWGGRGKIPDINYSVGSGQMHAAGVHCLTFLLMAKMCGVEVDETVLKESLDQFYRFSGHGNVAYGDGLPEGGYRDNGKTGGLAVAMAAAALLTPDGENSVYARARDHSAMKSFYATNWFHVAHTGGGIGEIWHHYAMTLVRDSHPVQYRSYLDTRRWMMDLSRRFNGGIGIAGYTDRYDVSALEDERGWGTFFAMTYTLPRKHLQLYGAPRSQYAKTYKLPERGWGNKADDIFQSLDPVPGSSLTKADLLQETVENDASLPASVRMNRPDVTEEELVRFFHHPEFGMREGAMRAAVIGQRYHLVMPLLNAEDPRLRHTGVMALAGMFKGSPMPVDQITPQMWERLGEIIEDPNESWWVTQEAVHALGRANPAIVARHTDRLVQLLEHDSWWLNMAAGNTLATIATDPKHYKNVLPKVIGHVTGSVTIQQMRPASRLTDAIKSANPEVKAYAMKLLVDAYEGVPDEVKTPQGMVLTNLARTIRARLADMILLLPNGSDFALKTPKKTLASARSGNASDMYVHRGFKLDKSFVGKWHFLAKMSETDDIGKVAQRARDSIAQRKINSPTGRNAYRPVYLVLKDGGQLGKTTFWSGDMYIDALSGEARKMSVRKLDGKEYLLIEEGEFPDVFPEDWKPRYSLYEREQ